MLVVNGIYLSALSFLHIYTLTTFFLLTESCQSTLTVSHSGYDDSKCGSNHHPCHTLSYTFDKRAKADDVIQINGQDGVPYLMRKQHLVLANTTLIGTEGRAKIVGEFSVVGSYLFADVARGLYTSQAQVSINLVNLKLIRIGIIKIKNTLTTLNVQVFNCTVSKLSKTPIIDSSAAKTTVILKKSIISQVSNGLQVKSREVSLSIESSKINNLGRSYPERNCPQFIITYEFESFVACFRKSSFKHAFLIDLGVSNQKKSNFSILDCVFDDDSENLKHNGCFSGITLRNTTALIVNSSFTNIISRNSFIKAIASLVTFKECIFSNISSRLDMFSLSSSINGYFNKIHSELNGFNHGSVYLQSTEGIFQTCTFHNNTINGQYGIGGALYINKSNITVKQSLFKENTVTYSGGAIHMQKARSSFVNCTFERNSAKGLPDNISFGGAVSSCDRSNITVQQSLFKENTATSSSGAIDMQNTRGSFINCTFERNSAKGLPHKMVYGGAICSSDRSNITVQQSLFKENTATYSGGAIHMQKTRASFLNCTFERNSAKGLPHKMVYGGAICSSDRSNITVQQSLFKENTATYSGGAIHMQKTRASFLNCTFERNSAKSLPHKMVFGGAICSIDRSNLTVRQSLFKENTATYRGGAIDMQRTQGSFINCTFERNSAKSVSHKISLGGAICSGDRSNLSVRQSLFKENAATRSGGAIHMQKTPASFINCTFERNSAKSVSHKISLGWAISSGDRSNLTVRQSLFKENAVTRSGGAIHMRKTRASFINCTFEKNSAKGLPHKMVFGGAICSCHRSNITVRQNLFKENTATYRGGAIYMGNARGSFINCTFERNSAKSLSHKWSSGGAILSHDRSNIIVQHSLFIKNTAAYAGGAIDMLKARSLFVNCTFERNSIKCRPLDFDFGGAMCARTSSYLTMHQCRFKENVAAGTGGATFIQDSESSFENCTFEGKVLEYCPQ